MRTQMKLSHFHQILSYFIIGIIVSADVAIGIRFPNPISQVSEDPPDELLKTTVFALGSFWRSESVFGCLDGVVRTTVGYAGGSKSNPEYRSLGDHAESVQVCIICSYILLPFLAIFVNLDRLHFKFTLQLTSS